MAVGGFFVAGADAELPNAASKVLLVRDGDRNRFYIANNYEGNVADFARIVPIPELPSRDQVRPRLHVRYNAEKFPQDPIFRTVSVSNLLEKLYGVSAEQTAGLPRADYRSGVAFQGRYVIRRQQGGWLCPGGWWQFGQRRRQQQQEYRNLECLTGWTAAEVQSASQD